MQFQLVDQSHRVPPTHALALRMRQLAAMRCFGLQIVAVVLAGTAIVQAGETVRQTASRQEVRAALEDVERWVTTSPDAAGWYTYLAIAALKREISADRRPDFEALKHSLRQLENVASVSPRLEKLRNALQGWLVWEYLPAGDDLTAVAESILNAPRPAPRPTPAKLVSVVTTVDNRDLRARLAALLATLASYADKPSDELAAAIDSHLRFLETARAAKPLTAAVREYFGHPNVWFDISEDLLDDSVVRRIERHEELRDVIQATPLTGRGVLRGATDLVIEPQGDRALLRIVFIGRLDAHTLGRNGPATVRSHSLTTFRAEKLLVLDGNGLQAIPAVCTAQTQTLDSNIDAVRPGLGSRLIRRLGARRWGAVQAAAERESAQHAEVQIVAAVDREADELIKRLDRLAVAPMLALAGGQANNARIRFCSNQRMLRIGAIYGPLGAPPGRPKCDEHRSFTVNVHSALYHRLSSQLAAVSPNSAIANHWNSLAWNWIDRMVMPRLMPYGISLRGGEWGTLVPVSLAGDWLAVEWQADPGESRLAEAKVPRLN